MENYGFRIEYHLYIIPRDMNSLRGICKQYRKFLQNVEKQEKDQFLALLSLGATPLKEDKVPS